MGTDYIVLVFTFCLVFVYGEDKSKMGTDKVILRYGFHRTKDCHDFQRAFLCVRKCSDMHYDIAHTDKNCVCTCFHRKDKAKYTHVVIGQSTKWRLGAPTTSVPAWAHQHKIPLLGNGFSDVSHETGGLSGEHGDVANGTMVELGEPTESGVIASVVGENSTAIEGATGADADISTTVAAVNGTAGDFPTTVTVTS